ncbi:MAG: SDR family oxidoreductase [Pseudomonadota bacterium]|nr:SDR family oxidoreductase [Pseudomonadota bacterium]
MNLDLRGKNALVTGSTQGIGRAISEALVKEGADVVINGRDELKVSQAVDELSSIGNVQGIASDMSTDRGIKQLIRKLNDPIDILVNNVGQFEIKNFFEISDIEWSKMFDLNVLSGVRLSRAFGPTMLEKNWGRIVFIGSDQSAKPNPEMAHYAMTKTAQVSISRSLAELTKGTSVTVNTILAAPTWTTGVEAFVKHMAEIEETTPEEMSREYFSDGEGKTSLIDRWAKPEEIASLVTFLCSPLASAINGAALRVDGGMVRSLF